MFASLGWWLWVVALPFGGGALLTLFSIGSSGKRGARGHARGHAHSHAGGHGHAVHGHGAHAHGAPAHGHAPAHGTAHSHTGTHTGHHTGNQHNHVADAKAAVKATAKTATKVVQESTKHQATRAAELPPLFLLQNFLLVWSLFAVAVAPLKPQSAAPALLGGILVAVALASVLGVTVLARVFAQLTPTDATSISTKAELEGRVGECDATIDSQKGSILVRDGFGTLHHLAARAAAPITRGQEVLLVEYNATGDFFLVRPWTNDVQS